MPASLYCAILPARRWGYWSAHQRENPHEADVGYALLPQAQGQGYASEALRAICDYGFTTLGIHAINAGAGQ